MDKTESKEPKKKKLNILILLRRYRQTTAGLMLTRLKRLVRENLLHYVGFVLANSEVSTIIALVAVAHPARELRCSVAESTPHSGGDELGFLFAHLVSLAFRKIVKPRRRNCRGLYVVIEFYWLSCQKFWHFSDITIG